NRGISDYRINDSNKVPNAALHLSGQEIQHIVANLNPVTAQFINKYFSSGVEIWCLNFCCKSPFESGNNTFLDVHNIHRRTVRSQYDLFSVLVQIIENVEETVLRS